MWSATMESCSWKALACSTWGVTRKKGWGGHPSRVVLVIDHHSTMHKASSGPADQRRGIVLNLISRPRLRGQCGSDSWNFYLWMIIGGWYGPIWMLGLFEWSRVKKGCGESWSPIGKENISRICRWCSKCTHRIYNRIVADLLGSTSMLFIFVLSETI